VRVLPAPVTRCIGPTVHLAVAVVFTWPLAVGMHNRLPLGDEGEATVPLFNLWSLRWTAQTLPHSWSRWWDAPIFWPGSGSYARSELQPMTGLVFGALRWITNDTTAYGTIVLFALALNGIAAAALARRIGSGRRSATVAGVLAQTVPFLSQQLGVVQLLMIWPVLFGLGAAMDWIRLPRPRTAAVVGVWTAVGAWTCSYHVALGCLTASAALPWVVRRASISQWRARLGGLVLASVTSGVLVAPLAIGQSRRLGSTVWTADTITAGSALWSDLAPGGRHWPGTALLALGVSGAIVARGRRSVRVLATMAVVATVLSTGLRLSVFGVEPYGWLVDHVSTIARMRSPFRATALTQVLLAVIAAPAIERLIVHRRDRITGGAVGGLLVLIVAVVAVEPGAGEMVRPPDGTTTWVSWLGDHPGGSVAMMPMPVDRPASAFEQTTEWMVVALDHGHPLVNGYTGFFPAGDRSLRLRMRSFPDAVTVDELRDLGVRYIVADQSWWTGEKDRAAADLGVTPLLGGPDGRLLDLGEPGN